MIIYNHIHLENPGLKIIKKKKIKKKKFYLKKKKKNSKNEKCSHNIYI